MSCVESVNDFFCEGDNSVYHKFLDVVYLPIKKIEEKFNKIENSKLKILLGVLFVPIALAAFGPLLVISASLLALALCTQLIALTFAAAADGLVNIYGCCTKSNSK